MGNINQSLLSDAQQEVLENFQELDVGELSLYGPFLFTQEISSNQEFFYKEFQIQKSFSNMTPDLFSLRLTNPSPVLLRLKAGNILEDDENFEGFILIEAFDLEDNLANEISKKQQGVRFFSEEELWKILESTLMGLEFMFKFGKSCLCVTPFQIYKQNGIYKLLDFEDLTDVMDKLDLTESPMCFYQSPHIITAIQSNEEIKILEKDNIFSLGLCLLEAANLEHPMGFAESEEQWVEFAGLEQSLKALKSRYSATFIEFIRSMVVLEEEQRPSLESLIIEFKRLERLTETPKSLKHKDELFGLGKSKINTGISIPFSNDFRFSGQSPLHINEKAPKNMVLANPKAIIEENESHWQGKNHLKDPTHQEIYYLSSEVLPKSELFKSDEANLNPPAKTFADYRVSIQSRLEEDKNSNSPINVNENNNNFNNIPLDRTSDKFQDGSNRPSHFKRDEESVKKGGFLAEVNILSPQNIQSPQEKHIDNGSIEFGSREFQIEPHKASYESETIEFQSPEKPNIIPTVLRDDEHFTYLNMEFQPQKSLVKSEKNSLNPSFHQDLAIIENKKVESSEVQNEKVNIYVATENSSQMQHTSEFPYYRYQNEPRKLATFGTSNYDSLTDKVFLSQSYNYSVEKPQDENAENKFLSQSYQIGKGDYYSIYQPIEAQNNAFYNYNLGSSYNNDRSPNFDIKPEMEIEGSFNQDQSPNFESKPVIAASEETKQLPAYENLRFQSQQPVVVTSKPLEESKLDYQDIIKQTASLLQTVENRPFENSDYYDRPVSRGEKSLMSSLDNKPFEVTQFLDKTPEKLLFTNYNLSEQKTVLTEMNYGLSNTKYVFSTEGSALRLSKVDEEFQRKSRIIQENKDSVDRSLNVLRSACNFLKERKGPFF